jgi:hypothetical protein
LRQTPRAIDVTEKAFASGNNVPRWVRTDRQVAWLTGMCLLGLTLRRQVHETGLYDEVYKEALDKGLLKLTGIGGMGRAGLALAA